MFPFSSCCCGDGQISGRDFHPLFMRTKPADLHWYAYDVVLHSPTRVTFEVFDMRDNVYGGVGAKIASLDARCDPSVSVPAMRRQARRLAEAQRARELEQVEDALIRGYADSIYEAATEGTPT